MYLEVVKFFPLRIRLLTIGLVVSFLAAGSPIEYQESLKEIEEVQEVKLYVQIGNQTKEKPKANSEERSYGHYEPIHRFSEIPILLPQLPKYILYHHLIFYE